MASLCRVLRKRKRLVIASVVMMMITADILIGWYTATYTTENKTAEIQIMPYNILDVQQSYSNTLLMLSDDGVRLSSPGGFLRFDLKSNATGACIGDMTNAVAISTMNNVIQYYQPGMMTPHFSVQVNGSARLIGITERYANREYLPDQLILLSSDTSATSLVALSIPSDGKIQWTRSLGSAVVAIARSSSTHHFALALANNSVYLFSRISNIPTAVYRSEEPVREIAFSNTGVHLAVMSGHDPTRLSVYESGSLQPLIQKGLPGNCTDLKLQKEIESIYVRSENSILEISNGANLVKVSEADIRSYAVPTAVGSIFVSTRDGVLAYKTERSKPVWEAKVGDICRNVITDFGATVVIGFDSNHLVIIDNTDVILGSKTGWFVTGLAVIGDFVVLALAFSWKRVRNPKKGTMYVLLIGAFVGIAVSSLFVNKASADVFGGTVAYLIFVGILGAIVTFIVWTSEAGIGGIALGVGVGLVTSVPLALVFQFVLWYSGFAFSMTDPVFKSILNGLIDGVRTGLIGGISGYIISRLWRQDSKKSQ